MKNLELKVFSRDENGNLIPEKEKVCDFEIYLIPLTKGQIKKLGLPWFNPEYIWKNCVKYPKINNLEKKLIKKYIYDSVITKVLEISGIDTELNKSKSNREKEQTEFNTYLKRISKNSKEASFVLFMHKQGYDFFNINKLTIAEFNQLIEGFNKEQEDIKRQYERSNRKSIA